MGITLKNKIVLLFLTIFCLVFVMNPFFENKLISVQALEQPHTAEVIYSVLSYESGEIKYTLQSWVNKEKILANTIFSQKTIVEQQIDTLLEALKDTFEGAGLAATYNKDESLVDVTLASYPSSHKRAVADSERNGYEPYDPKDGLEKWGFYRSTYSWEDEPVFKDMEDSYLEVAVNYLLELDAVNDSNLYYIYNYGTSISPKTIFSNADKVYVNTKYGLYIHEFVMQASTLSDKSITLSQKAYNSLGWNSTLILATIATLSVLLFIKHKKETKENKTDKLGIKQ